MSLARTALRLAAIEALLAHPVLDRLVEGRVYDSLISALDHREPVPVIIVTTEATKRKSVQRQNGGSPYWTTCNLVFEIAMASVEGDDSALVLGYAGTDREMEARLDLIEACCFEALDGSGPATPASDRLRDLVTRLDPRESETQRFSTDQSGMKLAVFLITIEVDLKVPSEDDPLDPPTGEFAALPEPLRSLAQGLTTDSARETCRTLAAALAPPAPLPPPASMASIDFTLAPQALGPNTRPSEAEDTARGILVAARADFSE